MENGLTIAFVSVTIPLALVGLSALSHPENENSVMAMHVYQWFFVLRVILTTCVRRRMVPCVALQFFLKRVPFDPGWTTRSRCATRG